MLPRPLLHLLLASLPFSLLTLTSARTPLSLDDITSLNTLSLPSPPSFSIPAQGAGGAPLSLTIALCSAAASPAPRFVLSNASNADGLPDPSIGDTTGGAGKDVREVLLSNGFGNWTGYFPQGGVLVVDVNGAGDVQFDIGLSDGDPRHEVMDALPLLGDTTSNQAILFSPPFAPLPPAQAPTYPNYTLPPPSSALSVPPSSSPPSLPTNSNITLLITPTSSLGTSSSILNSACFLAAQPRAGVVANTTVWARDPAGFRVQWLVEGLAPATNYTAYVLNGTTGVSGPVYFATKSAAFACPLVHSLPFCPGVAYAVPLPPPPGNAGGVGGVGGGEGGGNKGTYDAASLPANISAPVLSYLANFTTVLTTFACGRDWYSPLVGCDDCQRAYRAWLCAVSFTRCAEPSVGDPQGFTAFPPEPSATGVFASFSSSFSSGNNNQQQQQPLSALLPVPTTSPARPLSPLPAFSQPYTQLLPCIEQCHAADRACPPFVGFRCPVARFNAGASYGVGYVDAPAGERGRGITGESADRWGNVWCGYQEVV